MGLVALQSVVNTVVSSVLGYSIPPRPGRFRLARRGVPSVSSPAILRPRVHPLLSSPPLQRTFCQRPARSVDRAPSVGFSSLIATSASGVHLAVSFPGSPTVRPQRFSRSRRLAPLLTLGVCFAPLPRPGFALQGFSPPPSRSGSSPQRALLPFPPSACRRSKPSAPARGASSSGRCSRWRSVMTVECLARPVLRSPRVLLLPRVCRAAALLRPSSALHP